jgi:hypothetical protein
MSEPRGETPAGVDRRNFVLGATSAFGAAALAWIARPDVAEGAASLSEAQTVSLPQGLNTTQFAIHQDAPVITPVDGGQSGRDVGDSFYFHADLRLTPGGAVVGQVFGSKVVVKTATSEHPEVEQRITHLFFTSNDRHEQIVVAGVPDYPMAGAEFDADQPVVRAIVGGTGIFIGARGQLTSTRHPAGGYTQLFTLVR